MKIVLASEENCNDNIAKELSKLLESELLGKKVVLIPNAGEGLARQEMVDQLLLEFSARRGMNVNLVDIEEMNYYGAIKVLENAEVISISGGMVSRLMNTIDAKNLKKKMLDLLERKVFLTFSAGTMAMSKTQFMAQHYIGEADPEVAFVDGFGAIDFEIYPHYKEEQKDEILQIIPPGVDVWAIKDNEAIVIDGDDMRFVGNPIKLSAKG